MNGTKKTAWVTILIAAVTLITIGASIKAILIYKTKPPTAQQQSAPTALNWKTKEAWKPKKTAPIATNSTAVKPAPKTLITEDWAIKPGKETHSRKAIPNVILTEKWNAAPTPKPTPKTNE